MKLVDSVPITDIDTESVKMELSNWNSYYVPANVLFNITNVNLTEWDKKMNNPLITKMGKKKTINITISGQIKEPFHIDGKNIKYKDPNITRNDRVNIQNKNINITFNGVRLIRDKVWNNELMEYDEPIKLMVDNSHELYGFLKPIFVNKGEMSILSEKNIFISFKELHEVLKNITVNLSVKDIGNFDYTVFNWITEYEKGDTNGN